MFIKECECGSNHFIINEGISHSAELDCDGDLTVYGNQANEIESIICRDCERIYSEKNFNQINF